jgi:hypothetical protein
MEQSGCRWERSAAAKALTATGTDIAALGPRVVVSAFEQVWAILVVAEAALRMQSSHHLLVAHMQTAMYS